MQSDVRLRYEEMLDASHHGHPTIVQTVRTGNRGRPRIHIDPQFLQWAYSHRSTSGIHRFLNVGRTVVRNALIEYGIAMPQQNPFTSEDDHGQTFEPGDLIEDHILDPELPAPMQLPNDVLDLRPSLVSFTGPVSTLNDDQLDDLIIRLRSHFRRAGISMLDGMLRRIGHRVPRDRIGASLTRIDPVQRVFQRIRIRRRIYSVPGPNSLWHHDGQHGASFCILLCIMYINIVIRSYPMGYCDPWVY